MSRQRITIEDLAAAGAELGDDRLAGVAGGQPMDGDGAPTVDAGRGTFDAPGTAHLTGNLDTQL
jgi:putative ATP-grasp target RiPP